MGEGPRDGKPTAYMLLLLCSMSAIGEMAIRGCRSEKKKGGKKVTVVGCVVENEGHMMMTDKEHPGGVVL